MKLGIFSKVFAKYDFNEALSRITEHGIYDIQFNFTNVGLESLPEEIPNDVIDDIKKNIKKHNVTINVISGTFNTLENDKNQLERNIHCFGNIVRAAEALNVPFVSISTGSFNQEDFWSSHPDNHTEKAWERLFHSLEPMLKIAEKHNVTIVFEPEQANVVSTDEDAIRLMDHFHSDHLKVLFDPANLINKRNANNALDTIDQSIETLKDNIALAHCKDVYATSETIEFRAVGKGNLPLISYIKILEKYYDGPFIMHGLEEEDVPAALEYLKENE